MALGPVLALLALAGVCRGADFLESEYYPTTCSGEEMIQVNFLAGRVAEERGPDDQVKLSFQYLHQMVSGYTVELDIHIVFSFMGHNETQNSTKNCIGLSSLHLLRQTDRKTLYKSGEKPREFERNHKGLKFFENFQEFELEARFKPNISVGWLTINQTCWEKERRYDVCVDKLEVVEKMDRVFSLTNPFSEEFWDSVRDYLHRDLGGELAKLHTAFPYDHDNVLFRWLMWMLDQDHVDIYDFRMSSSDYDPSWGSLNTSWLQIMPLLTRLDLSNNGITDLLPEYLTSVDKNLTFLNLGRNSLSTIPPEIFKMEKLTFLDLSRNPFQNIDTFFDAKHLNVFQHVTFFNMSSVPIRDMNHINSMLRNVSPNVKAMTLTVLDLSFCELKEFHKYPDLFSEQKNMTHLFLAGNRMGNSPRLHFGGSQKLLTIDLTFNNLTTPLHILDEGSVTNLNISLNNITDWTNYDWEDSGTNISVFGSVDHLNMSLNTIPVLTEVMGGTLEELKTVDLGGNPIDCENCSIPQFKNWLKRYQNNNDTDQVVITLFTNPVKDFYCTRPLKFKTSLVSNVTFDDLLCQKGQNLFILIGIPLAAIGSLFILLGIILYAYRYEATYLLHLVKIKKRMKASADRFEGDYKYDAFVCYSGSDRAWVVGDLLPKLENGPEKYRLCLHERDFMLGTFITSNIVDAMQNSRNTIVVLTENFVKSQWCKWELEMANHKLFEESREFLVLIELERLDRSALPRYLKYLMDTRTYLEWPEPGDRTGEVEVVYKRLKEALGPSIHELEEEQMQYEEQPTCQDIALRDTTA